jgi:hypothetical protein
MALSLVGRLVDMMVGLKDVQMVYPQVELTALK